ncbi:hypothetical protein RKD27_007912 [Streptomyces sp. SAI-126]|uniref:hypothetical protein n=1 Tax=Streptomyces sp. SAI-126 TaxID=3377732 RepID=UPI003C7B4B7B
MSRPASWADAVGRPSGARAVGRRYRDEAQVLLDAPGLVVQASAEIDGRVLPRSVEPDEVGDHVEAAGLGLDGDPPAAVHVAGDLDSGGAGETVGDLGPLRTAEVTVVGVEADIEVGDGLPVTAGAGRERVLEERVFEVVGPLDGARLLVVQGVGVQRGPVGDDRVLGQTLLGDDRPAEGLAERIVCAVGAFVDAGDHVGVPSGTRRWW